MTDNNLMDDAFMNMTGDGNLTIKWIHGDAQDNVLDVDGFRHLIFPSQPSMTLLSCKPVVETASALIVVNAANGQVSNSTILTTPVLDTFPWIDPGTMRKIPVASLANLSTYDDNFNVTASFGQLFNRALLQSASLRYMGSCLATGFCKEEDLDDRTFNIRQPGLNADFMSYSMLSLVDNDHEALLDPLQLAKLASKVYSTYFQHFAIYNTSATGNGGWAFQRINDTVPSDIPPPWLPSGYVPPIVFASSEHPAPTMTIVVERPIETLRMSRTAVLLSSVVLVWLFSTVCMVSFQRRYFSSLLRGVGSLADVALMVAGSERLLQFARDQTPEEFCKADFSTRLGWFRTKSGEVRWGIELVDGHEEPLGNDEVQRLMQGRGTSQQRWI